MPYRCISFNGKYIKQKKVDGKWKKVSVHANLDKCKASIRAIGFSKSMTNQFNLSLVGNFGFDFSGEDAAENIRKIDGQTNPINIRINSKGGVIDDGIAFYNAVREAKSKVNVYFDGKAQSTALWAASSADHIVATENTVFLVHAPKVMMQTNQYSEEELRSKADALNVVRTIVKDSLMSRAKKEINLERDMWMTAGQALDYGLIDGIAPVYSKIVNLDDDIGVPEAIVNWVNSCNKEIENMTLIDLCAELQLDVEDEDKAQETLVNFFSTQKKEIEELKAKLEEKADPPADPPKETVSESVVNMAVKYRTREVDALVDQGKITGAAAKEFKDKYCNPEVLVNGIESDEFDNMVAIFEKNEKVVNFDPKTGLNTIPKGYEEDAENNPLVANAIKRAEAAKG